MSPKSRAGLRRGLLALSAAALLAGAASAPAVAAVSVPTVAVGSAARGAGFETDATLQALQQSTVGAQIAGNVLQLAVKAGDRVRAGQVLVRIDERDAQADAEQRNAQTHVQRTRDLRAQGFVSQAALDVAETQLKAADAGVQQARAARAQAALARGFAAVTAPFDAVVLATHVETGDLAAPGRPLVTLYAPGRVRAVVNLAASRSAAARTATTTEVQLPDGRWVVPVARTELPGTDAVSQTVEWRLDLAPADGAALLPGQSVRVRFAGGTAAAAAAPAGRLVVPAGAVLRRGELTAVYAAQDGRFVLKAVRLGAAVGDGIEVLAGLKAGERVALDPVRAGLAGAVPAAQ
ncbi:MAG: efflux RND transporter periplasmic adaptor subunit [Rubrivivax sp.]|nr:efflux RND transporter periplasmic adaptor subunit [Rubrivivax sp.]